MGRSSFSTCIQILSQAKQSRMAHDAASTLQPTTVFLIAIWKKKHTESIQRSTGYLWNKRFVPIFVLVVTGSFCFLRTLQYL